MSTISQRLREIAERMPTAVQFGAGYALNQDKKALLSVIEELEAAPAADAVPVVAYIVHESVDVGVGTDRQALLRWDIRECDDRYEALVTEADYLSAIAALQQQLGECDAGYRTMEREVAALQARIAELEARQVPAKPKGREAGRMGDMAPAGHSHLRVGLDADGDAYVSVWEQEQEAWAGIEFCTYSGGGKSPKTREALIALMVAIEADNAATPSHQWPQVAAPSNPTGGAT